MDSNPPPQAVTQATSQQTRKEERSRARVSNIAKRVVALIEARFHRLVKSKSSEPAKTVNGNSWAPSSSYRSTNFFTEVGDALKWVHDRAAALGVIGLGLANWLWIDFVSQYNLPIGFFSPALLSALPSILVSVVIIVMFLTAGALTPAMALGMPLTTDGPSLVDFRGKATADSTIEKPFDAWKGWLKANVIAAGYWILLLVGGSFAGVVFTGLLLFLSTALTILIGLQVLTNGITAKKSFDFWLVIVGALLMQNMLLLEALAVALKTVTEDTFVAIAMPGVAYLVFALFIAAGQCIVAGISAKRGFYRGILVQVLICAGLYLFLLATFPQVGGPLASLPIRITSSGARSCVVLLIREDPAKPLPKRLKEGERDASGFARTNAVSMAPMLDGTYYLKLNKDDSGDIYLLPKESVGAITTCAKPNSSATSSSKNSER
ncbi:hypothetical protein P5Y53_08990 [Dyella jiangningensis]|uniref:hypothetical protein n=1 Tax=Dyella jiangningensis TaxID=1379159 RepID=UPI00240E9E61|nr:hypothetical protein [Dyella jiangningensis]MDG2537794.1 hypothetical protein [Dyella jiangningensis]